MSGVIVDGDWIGNLVEGYPTTYFNFFKSTNLEYHFSGTIVNPTSPNTPVLIMDNSRKLLGDMLRDERELVKKRNM